MIWSLIGFLPLVPKLHLGTHLSAKLCWSIFLSGATKCDGDTCVLAQLGNEEGN